MRTYGITEKEMNAAQRFENFHKRMGLRNKLSNALMAIALFQAKASSENLSSYTDDGLNISEECISILRDIEQNNSIYEYRNYTSKVLLDILTNQLSQEPNKSKLEMYRKGFSVAREVFDMILQNSQPNKEMLREAEQTIKEIDKEIESVYATEESAYHGTFLPRPIQP